MTPLKKKVSPAVKALIEDDLPEDSSDEEYMPDQDEHSEDETDGTLEKGNFDSKLYTPVVYDAIPTTDPSPEINNSSEGIFKIPE